MEALAKSGGIVTDDFVDNVRKRDAAEAARQRAIAGPERHAERRTQGGGHGYAEEALRREGRNVRGAGKGTRNDILNTAGFNLGQLVAANELEFGVVVRELRDAALDAGLTDRELKQTSLPERAVHKGMETPRDMSDKGSRPKEQSKNGQSSRRGRSTDETSQEGQRNGKHFDEDDSRRVVLKPLHTVKTRVPQWVWTYNDVGRIQLGTLTMFAGRPAAGKSTAVRWFAAQISNGTLPGVWEGTPLRVGLYMSEEQIDYTVAPGLMAAGANMHNIVHLGVSEDGHEDGLLSVRDEHRITEELCDNKVRALFVDPVMSTFDGKVMDAHKNVDVRRHLSPYVRIAQAINGIVVTVTHLRKGQVRDVMENINGSSAFGELPRAVFGFASVGDGSNVMEQVKNSAGPAGLKLEYHLPVENVVFDDGQQCELPRFEIRSETELSIIDLGGDKDDEDATTASADVLWLRDYLLVEQPAPSSQVKRDARDQADMSEYRLHKARKKLRCRIVNQPTADRPYTTAWCLPDSGPC